MVAKRRPKLTLNTAIVRKGPSPLKNINLNSAISLARDERINSSRNILTVLEGGKTYSKPIKILPNLYLGSCDATKDLNILLDKDITTILNLAAEVEKPKWFNSDHWMDLSNNHWVTKITQNQLEEMSFSSDASSEATKVNDFSLNSLNSPPSPPPSEDEDSKKNNLCIPSQDQTTIFPLSPLQQKSYIYSSEDTIPSTPLTPTSPRTPTSIGSSSQQTLVLSPLETSFVDSASVNTLNTPFVDSYSYALPPETPFMDTVSTLPETPYVDTFSTPMTSTPNQLPPETPYYDTFNGSPSMDGQVPETPYTDAFSNQQQQQNYLAKLISKSHKSLNDSDLLQAISLSSASTPPSATLSSFNAALATSKRLNNNNNSNLNI